MIRALCHKMPASYDHGSYSGHAISMPGVCLRDPVSVDLRPTNSGVSTDAQQRSQSRTEIVLAWGPFFADSTGQCLCDCP